MDETLGIMFCNCISVVNPFLRLHIDCAIQFVIAGKEGGCAPEDKIIFPQQGFRIVDREVMGKIAVNIVIIFEKIFLLRQSHKNSDQHKTEQNTGKPHDDRRRKRELSVV